MYAGEYFARATSANNPDRAITQNSPKDTLVNLDALNFRVIHLKRLPADQNRLDNHPLIGDGKLIGVPVNQWRYEKRKHRPQTAKMIQ